MLFFIKGKGKKSSLSVVDEAEKIVNTHSYEICSLCDRNNECENYCLPVEMFVQIVDEPDELTRLRMVRNIEHLFTDI
jgi:hypothetical protein